MNIHWEHVELLRLLASLSPNSEYKLTTKQRRVALGPIRKGLIEFTMKGEERIYKITDFGRKTLKERKFRVWK